MTGLIPGWRARALAASLCIAALLAACAEAPPSPLATGATPETLALAGTMMDRIGFDRIMEAQLAKRRETLITATFEDQLHRSPAEATRDVDEIVMPDIRASIPDLKAQYEDATANLFTADELRSILNNEQSPASASAQAKMPEFRERLAAIGRKWGRRVSLDTLQNHAAELNIPAQVFAQPGLAL